jgi:hypothetical protein
MSCEVQLTCLRKLGSAQQRCFPLDPNFEQFRCDGERANRSTPGPTATPTPTATPRQVAFTVNASTSVTIQTFQVTATYPPAKGTFAGGGCSANTRGTVTSNDNSTGTLTVGFTSTVNLAFPIIITCSFAEVAGQTLSASDIATSVDQVGLAASVTVT